MTKTAKLDKQVTEAPHVAEAGHADAHADSHADDPKREPSRRSNAEKDPDDWVTGDEPMTGAQASYLKTLSEQAKQPEAYSRDLSKAEASKRIDALKQGLGL